MMEGFIGELFCTVIIGCQIYVVESLDDGDGHELVNKS